MASTSSVDNFGQDKTRDAGAGSHGWAPAIVSAVVVMLTGLAAAWSQAPPIVTCVTGAGLALLLVRMLTRRVQAEAPPASASSPQLVSDVLPVWRRHIESARKHSEDSVSGILTSFGAISERLDMAMQVTQGDQANLTMQSAEEVLARNQDALGQMLAPMREALASRDEAYVKLDTLSEAMADLRQICLQIKQLARRTNMVALNASVEASRAGDSGSGFAVVAQEVRQLATQSGDAANKMMSRTNGIDLELQALRTRAAAHDSSDEALRDQVDRSARAVISGLLQSLGEVNRSSQELQEAGSAVHAEVESVLMNFQTQDRLNQMLSCVMDDMNRLSEWLTQGGDLSASQASEWLARLDASYTMEEQRSEHHGNTSIQRETAIEFF